MTGSAPSETRARVGSASANSPSRSSSTSSRTNACSTGRSMQTAEPGGSAPGHGTPAPSFEGRGRWLAGTDHVYVADTRVKLWCLCAVVTLATGGVAYARLPATTPSHAPQRVPQPVYVA